MKNAEKTLFSHELLNMRRYTPDDILHAEVPFMVGLKAALEGKLAESGEHSISRNICNQFLFWLDQVITKGKKANPVSGAVEEVDH